MKKIPIMSVRVSFIVLMVLPSGCAYGRKSIKLETGFADAAKVAVAAEKAPSVIVRSIADGRDFSGNFLEKPSVGISTALTPLDGSDYSKARLVGRVSNGLGMPCGDVAAENTTVADHVRVIVERSFADAGFRVLPSSSQDMSAAQAFVTVENFWGWLMMRYFADTKIKIVLSCGDISDELSAQTITSKFAWWGTWWEWEDLFKGNSEELRVELVKRLEPLAIRYSVESDIKCSNRE